MKKYLAATEIVTVICLVFFQIWIAGENSILPAAIALILIIASWISRKESFEDLGLRPPKMKKAWPIFFLLLLILSSLTVTFTAYNPKIIGSVASPALKILGYALRYFGWAFFQQLLLNGYFARRLKNVFRDTLSAAVATGIVFSLVHTPNPLLMIVTLFTGIGSGYLFLENQKFAGLYMKNLYILAIVHVAIGICIAHYLPAWLTLHMKVGPSALPLLGTRKP